MRLSPSFRPAFAALSALALLLPAPLVASPQDDIEALIAQHYPWTGSTGPGMLVGVWEGNTVVSLTSRGYADLDLPMGGDGYPAGTPGANPVPLAFSDQMRIASLTKSFTVTRVLQLAAAGAINLDAKLSSFSGIDLTGLTADPARFATAGDVTIRDLARMTSSLADYSNSPGMIAGLTNDLSTTYTPAQLLDFARGLPSTPDYWTYSNTNTLLLGMIVEEVTGNALGSELQTHVFDRVGLQNTLYPSTNTFPGQHAHGYVPDGSNFEDLTHASPSIGSGAGAMISTFDDLRVWIKAIATGKLENGGSLYGVDPLVNYDLIQLERLTMEQADGPGPHYDAYGLGIGELEEWLGHSGEFFGFQHMIMYDPETDRTVVIMMNASGLPGGTHVPIELFTDIAQYYAAIPEPSTLLMMVAGAGLLLIRRAKRHRA